MLAFIEQKQPQDKSLNSPISGGSHISTHNEKNTPPSSPSPVVNAQTPSMTLGVTNPSSICADIAGPSIVTPTSDDYHISPMPSVSPSILTETSTPSMISSHQPMALAPRPETANGVKILASDLHMSGKVVPPPPPLVPASPLPASNLEGNDNDNINLNGMPLLPLGCVSSMPKIEHTKVVGTIGVGATTTTALRLNKFVRRLHDMLQSEKDSGIVEWRCGLLVLHSTDAFAKKILPKYFNTHNFKTFRRQLNYYGFVHVRSFSATGSTTTALWVNQDLAKRGNKSISSVLMLKRVEPNESAKTAEGRRVRKELAVNIVENIGVNTRALQLQQIRGLTLQRAEMNSAMDQSKNDISPSPHFRELLSTAPLMPKSSSTYPWQSSQNLFPTTQQTNESAQAEGTSQSTDQSSDASTDDAAKLLLMLSKSVVQNHS